MEADRAHLRCGESPCRPWRFSSESPAVWKSTSRTNWIPCDGNWTRTRSPVTANFDPTKSQTSAACRHRCRRFHAVRCGLRERHLRKTFSSLSTCVASHWSVRTSAMKRTMPASFDRREYDTKSPTVVNCRDFERDWYMEATNNERFFCCKSLAQESDSEHRDYCTHENTFDAEETEREPSSDLEIISEPR